ncbi:DEAD/DEAH box helicase family protein [Janibacter sp. Y6]|uniref:DEAD/DEAH box helicase n=1 Tax=Janibacter sp. Y6 TaxID=2913552 RepID=UPI0034A23D0B
MRFTLKPYQSEAAEQILDNLDRARTAWHRDGDLTAFSLTATTGAGKTVMAAAAIEALFNGTDDFEADPGAVVIWFSDDPSLNLQTRDRLLEATESLTSSDLVVVEPPFAKPKLAPGKVYFLNTGKLNKNSLLTRGHHGEAEGQLSGLQATPDTQGWTIWETISNTIDDEDLTVYLILDEAHRGFNPARVADKPTLVRRLINGHAGYKPIPIVWGISATIQRFDDAMKAADATKNRRALPRVQVNPARVQESGLVKDTIALSIPDEAGVFDITLVRVAAERLKASAQRWARYAKEQRDTTPVVPLLILQSPKTPEHDEIGEALDAIAEVIDIDQTQVRHVFGEHKVVRFGRWDVDWIEPQRIEDKTSVRVVVAKDAISTGWDCPRAEVLVSFRAAKDHTHITQLLGRMVRNPLARRVPGDDRLNAVDCILPFFDRTTAGNVVKYLTGQLDDMPGGGQKRVYLDGRDLLPNPAIPEEVWQLWESLPSQTMPVRGARPVIRLVSLAQALSADDLRPGAIRAVKERMVPLLDECAQDYASDLDAAVEEIWSVKVKEILGRVGGSKLSYRDFAVRADTRAIRTGFNFAKAALGSEVAMSYVDHLAREADDEDSLRDAFVKTAALASTRKVRERVDAAANAMVDEWFKEFGADIRSLTDERQQEYETIRGLAVDPQKSALGRSRVRMEDYKVVDKDSGQVKDAELRDLHVMADADGNFPVSSLNPWELHTIDTEMARPGAVGWYRNPSRPAMDSLTIAYRDDQGNWHSMHPDFIFFHEVEGELKASIVDPHGHHLDDAGDKLRALASYADRYGHHYDRIEMTSTFGSVTRSIPLHDPVARAGVLETGRPALEHYHSDIAVIYGV